MNVRMCIYVMYYFWDIFMSSMCMDRIWIYVFNMYVICSHISNVCVYMYVYM